MDEWQRGWNRSEAEIGEEPFGECDEPIKRERAEARKARMS